MGHKGLCLNSFSVTILLQAASNTVLAAEIENVKQVFLQAVLLSSRV